MLVLELKIHVILLQHLLHVVKCFSIVVFQSIIFL